MAIVLGTNIMRMAVLGASLNPVSIVCMGLCSISAYYAYQLSQQDMAEVEVNIKDRCFNAQFHKGDKQ